MAGALRLRGIAPDAMTEPKQEPELKLMISRPLANADLPDGSEAAQ